MTKISEKLNIIKSAKNDIKSSIENKGIEVGDISINEYASKIDEIAINDCSYLFSNNSRIGEHQKILKLCKNITKSNHLFYKSADLTGEVDLTNYDYSNCDSLSGMFQECTNVKTVKFGNYDTSKVNNINYMFYKCHNLENVNINALNTTNVTKLNCMFDECAKLKAVDLSNFNTTKVTTMQYMLKGCSSLTEIDVSNFNTTNCSNLSYLFYGCSNLTEIDISNFDTTNCNDTSYMFYNCTKLNKVIINSSKVFKMTNPNMFSNTGISAGTGYIYVPDDLLQEYKTTTNWANYANQLKGLSELI